MNFSNAATPGMGPTIETQDSGFVWGRLTRNEYIGGVLDKDAVDPTNTPTTSLREGLVLARLPNRKYTNYDPANPLKAFPVGILNVGVGLYNPASGTTVDRVCQVLVAGNAVPGRLIGFDERVRDSLANAILWNDRPPTPASGWYGPIPVGAALAVTTADSGTHFVATAAVAFTLPPPAPGLRFRFTNLVAANASTVVVSNNANILPGGNSLALSGAGRQQSVEIVTVRNAAGNGWAYFILPSVIPA